MKIYRAFRFIAPLLVVVSALAENDRVCMAGNIEQLSAAQLGVCRNQVQQVKAAAARYGTPAWHFVVVCDEDGWKDYAAFSNTPPNLLKNADADNNFAQRTTFIRGSHLSQAVAEKILAEEMISISAKVPIQVAADRQTSR